MNWVIAIAGFALLVILHEFGHFIAAKATGMRVERFFLFFPPKIMSIKRGETEYGIGAIPLGGFVKITGMNPEELEPAPATGGEARARPGLATAMEGAGQSRPREPLPPEVLKRAYYKQPVWKRIVVIGAGPAMNVLVAFVILLALALTPQTLTHDVGSVTTGSPASGNLLPGDRIVSVDGVSGGFNKIRHQIASHHCAGKPPKDGCRAATVARVRVIRDGGPVVVPIRPAYDAALRRNILGINYATTTGSASIGQAVDGATGAMWHVTSGTVSALVHIFEPEQRKKLSGVVGITDVSQQAVGLGARAALTLLAVVSLALAIVNLFPFLPLDGGHIFWSLVEKVRGRPVAFSVIEKASAVGFVLVILLFAIGLTNDIGKLTGPGIHLR